MIKDIKDLSISYKFSDNLVISEKLDMFYFKIIINELNITLLSHNHKIISENDIIIDNKWSNVFNFINDEIKQKQNKILEEYGPVIIGFFYCPTSMPLRINYYNFLNTGIKNKEFIISNVKSIISKNNINISDFCKKINLLSIRGIGGGPIIVYSNDFISKLNQFLIDKNLDDLILYMNENMKTFSGNSFNDIEGIIINDNGKLFQLKIINESISETGYFAAYERFIMEFIKFWKKYKFERTEKTYIKTVNKIFLDFIETSYIPFNDYELIPPGNFYIGDLGYEYINDKSVETICKLNNLYKNIYRILFKSLKKYKKYNINFYYLTNDDIDFWNNIVDVICNKNN